MYEKEPLEETQMKKKNLLSAVLTVVLALAMCLSLAACGSTAAPAATEAPAADAAPAEAEAPAEDTAADSDKVFTVGICQLVQHDALDAATQGFMDTLKEKLGDKAAAARYVQRLRSEFPHAPARLPGDSTSR